MKIEFRSLGNGRTRILCPGIGYADVSAVYSTGTRGWTVEVQQTNITNPDHLSALVGAFRKSEGMEN